VPGAILSTTRVGNNYSSRISNFAHNRALASTGRGFAAPYGRQFVPPHNKFVVLDTDEATVQLKFRFPLRSKSPSAPKIAAA
jgi:hypothetical protein